MALVEVARALPSVPTIEVLYSTHVDAVTRWAAWLGGRWVDPDDIAQDVFLIAQRHLADFRGESSAATWLFRITQRLVRRRRRRERLRHWITGSSREAGSVACDRPTPIEALEALQTKALFHRALDLLSERHRMVIVLFELEGLSGQEIAEAAGVPVGTVWVWLHRARGRLAAAVAGLEGRKES